MHNKDPMGVEHIFSMRNKHRFNIIIISDFIELKDKKLGIL